MCPIPLVHKHLIQIIQVAATPLQRGVEGDEQWVRLKEVLKEKEWEDNRRREFGEARDFVQSTTVQGHPQVRLGLCHGLCDACALFCSCYQSLHVHLCLSPSLSFSSVAHLGSPYLSGYYESSVLFAHSSFVLLEGMGI